MYNVYNEESYLFSEKDVHLLYTALKTIDNCTIYNPKWGKGRVIKENENITTKYFSNVLPLDVMLIKVVLEAYHRKQVKSI